MLDNKMTVTEKIAIINAQFDNMIAQVEPGRTVKRPAGEMLVTQILENHREGNIERAKGGVT